MRLQFIKTAFWGITALLAVAIAGLIGYYQGFARSVGISDLDRTIPSLIADGVQMIRDVPGHVFDAGLSATTEWVFAIGSLILATGFLAIALLAPKASAPVESSFELTNTKKSRPNTPPDLAKQDQRNAAGTSADDSVDEDSEHSNVARVMAGLGGALALLVAVAHIAWTVMRHHQLGAVSILDSGTELSGWIETARIAAGIDTIVFMACVLWLLFAMRIPAIFSWLHVLGLVALGGAAAIAFAACSISVGTVSQINLQRPVVRLIGGSGIAGNDSGADAPTDDGQLGLLLGRTGQHLVIIRIPGNPLLVPAGQTIEVVARQSVPNFVDEHRGALEAAAVGESEGLEDDQ